MARRKMCSAGDRGVVVQEGPDAFRHGEHPLAHGHRRQDVIDEMGGGLDHTAHIGGFAAGAILIALFRNPRLLARHPYYGWRPQRSSAR